MPVILTQRLFARVQKILLISLSTRDAAWTHAQDFETGSESCSLHRADGLLMKLGITDDAAYADILFWQFELGLYENQKVSLRFQFGGDRL